MNLYITNLLAVVLVLCFDVEASKIVAYEYCFNNQWTNVSIPICTEFEMNSETILLPDVKNVAEIGDDSSFYLSEGKVVLKQNAYINFLLRLVNDSGDKSAPIFYNYTENYSLTKDVVELPLRTPIEFDKVSSGDFQAVRLTIPYNSVYYFNATQPSRMYIINGKGENLAAFDSESLLNTQGVFLSAGVYYGILFNTIHDENNPDNTIKLSILDTQKFIPNPVIEYNNGKVKIKCDNEDASIFYSIDGSEPPKEPYKGEFGLKHNAVIKAVAKLDGYADSFITSYTIDWFEVDTPKFAFDNGFLTISCDTPGSSIYYEIGGKEPSVLSTLYENKHIILKDNKIVKAFAVAPGFNDSKVESYIPNYFTCVQPSVISYNGHSLKLGTTPKDAVIYYTMDGSNPSIDKNNCKKYDAEIIVNDACTIKAYAVKDYFNSSSVLEYEIPYFYSEGCAYVKEQGNLSKAFEWCGGSPNDESVKIKGNLNDSDFGCIRGFKSTRHLDLGGVSLQSVPEKAFENMNLLTIVMPEVHFSAGGKLMTGCRDLAAIVWNSNTTIPLDILDGMSLPNMLLYVKYAAVANAQFGNIIVDNVADKIVLSDCEHSNFYAPIQFTARQITYSHNYSQKSGYDRCTGWESIALPFAPTSITHESRGAMAPFAANDPVKKPFWLCELTSSGFVSAGSIDANTPYIIAMPNNDKYSDEYILSGNVTFAGSNVRVEASDQLNISGKGSNVFVPNFVVTPKEECMALNVDKIYNGHAEGSLFALGLRDARPFEAYITNPTAMPTSGIFRISFDRSDVLMQTDDSKISVGSEGGRLKVFGLRKGDVLDIVSIDGIRICHETATESVLYIDNPTLGPVIITVHRNGKCLSKIKFVL